jgi:hypothetical protein
LKIDFSGSVRFDKIIKTFCSSNRLPQVSRQYTWREQLADCMDCLQRSEYHGMAKRNRGYHLKDTI